MTGVRTVTLTEFLLARIAEDEAVARDAAKVHGIEWHDEAGRVTSDTPRTDYGGNGWGWVVYADRGFAFWDCDGAGSLSAAPEATAQFARHDPARVLAECWAKRRIVAECRAGIDAWPATDNDMHFKWILEALALPYASHPDYDDEWKP